MCHKIKDVDHTNKKGYDQTINTSFRVNREGQKTKIFEHSLLLTWLGENKKRKDKDKDSSNLTQSQT